jgi:phosphinothricin acetyltransferase
MRIRDADDSDASAIATIYAHEVLHGTATYEVVAPDVGEMRARMRSGRDAGTPWLVAELDDAVVGYAYASAYRSRPGYRWTVEDSVYVAQAAQGQGVGSVLLRELISRCTAIGFRQMVAVIGDESNGGSIRMHEREGFAVAGRFPGIGRKHGRWLTGVQMMRALGEGDATPPFAEPDAAA